MRFGHTAYVTANDQIRQRKGNVLHRLLIERTGGEDGVWDEGLLESALEAPYATFDGKDLFPTKE